MAKERRVRYPLLWLVFVASMVAGAGLVSTGGAWRWLGLALLLGPLILLGVLTLAYYVVERRRSAP